jgi:hypothetical protein
MKSQASSISGELNLEEKRRDGVDMPLRIILTINFQLK